MDVCSPPKPRKSILPSEAAEILFGVVWYTLPSGASEDQVWGGVLAAWSFTHGFATLSLNTNFTPERDEDVEAAVHQAATSVVRLVAAGAFGH